MGNTEVCVSRLGVLVLKEGEILIHAQQKQTVLATRDSVTVGGGAVVAVKRVKNVLVVRVLHDTRQRSVEVAFGRGGRMQLSAGEELILGPDERSLVSALCRGRKFPGGEQSGIRNKMAQYLTWRNFH